MNFKEIVMSRYATKKFNGEKIPQDKVDELIELIRFSDSSFNMQTWKLKIISDPKMLADLKPVSFNQEQITTCSHLLVFCADSDLMGSINRIKQMMLDSGAKEEDIKAYIDMMTSYVSSLDENGKNSYARDQVFIALGNALNGAKALGFDSCPMGGFDPMKYKEMLNLSDNLMPAVICPIGYAADEPRPKMRFDNIVL